jgi:hypothetical protein
MIRANYTVGPLLRCPSQSDTIAWEYTASVSIRLHTSRVPELYRLFKRESYGRGNLWKQLLPQVGETAICMDTVSFSPVFISP